LPAQTREVLRGLVLFLRRYLGYEEIRGQDVPYYGPSQEEREAR
jgi:hypothetical protein